jgi:flavin reductase
MKFNSVLAPDRECDLRQLFLNGMSETACTVNIVTTDGPAGRYGVTVSAMSSVSADSARPILLVCVHQASPASRAIADNAVFCVNVLRDDQAHISDCFAGRVSRPDGDKFSCAQWTALGTGAPRIADPLVAFDCRVLSIHAMGAHAVIFGSVEELFFGTSGMPLVYARRMYNTPMPIGEAAAQLATLW